VFHVVHTVYVDPADAARAARVRFAHLEIHRELVAAVEPMSSAQKA
jgi:hypothetical protein